MKLLSLIILCFLPLLQARQLQTWPSDTIAVIGNIPIGSGEIVERLELMPFPGKENGRLLDSVKFRALYALMAEKLLALEARRQNLHENFSTTRMAVGLEKLLVRDELYRRDVVEKIEVQAEELVTGMKRFREEHYLLAFRVGTDSEGEQLVTYLNEAQRVDSRFLDSIRNFYGRFDTLVVTLGFPDETIEQAAFRLTKQNRATLLKMPEHGHVVLYLDRTSVNPAFRNVKPEDRARRVEQLLRTRKEESLALGLFQSILQNQTAQTDPQLFKILADSLTSSWKQYPSTFSKQKGYTLPSEALDVFVGGLSKWRSQAFVRFAEGSVSLGDILEMFRYKEFSSKDIAGPAMAGRLNAHIREIAADELIAREGYRRSLENSDRVRRDIRRWTDAWAARVLVDRVLDTVQVRESDIYGHLMKHKDYFGHRYEVNVHEVLSRTLFDVNEILEELRAGVGFAEIAARRSLRMEWQSRGGVSGYFPIYTHPELGFQALLSDTGKLVGPVGLSEGYSLFIVLGKRDLQDSSDAGQGGRVGEESREAIRSRLAEEKRTRSLNRYIASLAEKEGIAVRADRVRQLSINPAQMFTRRRIGFGGTMTAVPLLMQHWGWVDELPASDLPLP